MNTKPPLPLSAFRNDTDVVDIDYERYRNNAPLNQITVTQASELEQISRGTIYKLLANNEIIHHHNASKMMIDLDALELRAKMPMQFKEAYKDEIASPCEDCKKRKSKR
tara:strand:+ start:1072 stop:1398 length:327 start_codon:yes stop_codon:yes gene_type:complete